MLKDLKEETEKSAGRYYSNYFCPHCHAYMGHETQDGTRNYAVIETSFGLTDLQKRVVRIVRKAAK
jgi:hypothetical protein